MQPDYWNPECATCGQSYDVVKAAGRRRCPTCEIDLRRLVEVMTPKPQMPRDAALALLRYRAYDGQTEEEIRKAGRIRSHNATWTAELHDGSVNVERVNGKPTPAGDRRFSLRSLLQELQGEQLHGFRISQPDLLADDGERTEQLGLFA